MKCYALTHLADATLLRELVSLVAQDRATTAALLAHIAEVDARKLYLPAACSSMFTYCVRELHMSEDVAFRRIHVARAARRFPAIFSAIEEGGLNLTSVLLLAPYLRPENADQLLAAATSKSKVQIETLIAERFPRPDVPTIVRALGPAIATQLAPEQVDGHVLQLAPGPVDQDFAQVATELAPEQVGQQATQLAPEQVDRAIVLRSAVQIDPPALRVKLTPLSASHFEMRLTIDRETHEQLRYAQALLGHAVPSGDVAQVLKRALNALVQQLEQKKFSKCVRSRSVRAHTSGSRDGSECRYIPAEIRRAVWQRDQGQCTFVSAKGRRCEEKTRLEFDHTQPIARGGQTTPGQLQLKCRAHNQYAAECAYGSEFMRSKRDAARQRTAQFSARLKLNTRATGHAAPHP
jgi:5-methylcytosine-specific restriction endonuclease McrA